ncbi:MAG: LUD domain-containing protein [Desulfobacula sp.]|uniref:LutC/YkgG family protein n=1 Tax=Desulfobacula sp. TaxID=2593537 RepID=UPI0025C3A3E6|nr:LUD domain-containing protein [Desulfobacula sp.]MCD4718495.1 LUD domain-containing protein [Desulfobacula sp.]
MDNNQQDFIRTIRSSLGRTSVCDLSEVFGTRPKDAETVLNTYTHKSESTQDTLVNLFQEQAGLAHITIKRIKDCSGASSAILELVQNTQPEWGKKKSVIAWKHPLIDKLNLEKTLDKEDVTVFTTKGSAKPGAQERAKIRSQLIESYIGITSADFGVAQSATLVMRTRPNQPRAVSLVPSIHVAVITKDQIIENLKELYFRLKWDPKEKEQGLTNCMTFITGPSKTADIELEMVYGAHGPRQLFVFVIETSGTA